MLRTDVLVIGGGIAGLWPLSAAEAGAGAVGRRGPQRRHHRQCRQPARADAEPLHAALSPSGAEPGSALPFTARPPRWVRLEAELGPIRAGPRGRPDAGREPRRSSISWRQGRARGTKGLPVEILDRAALTGSRPVSDPRSPARSSAARRASSTRSSPTRAWRAGEALGVARDRGRDSGAEAEDDRVIATGGRRLRGGARRSSPPPGRGRPRGAASAWPSRPGPNPAHERHRAAEPSNPASRPTCRTVDHAEAVRLRAGRHRRRLARAGPGTPDGCPDLADSLLGNVALAAHLAPALGGLRVMRTWAGNNTPSTAPRDRPVSGAPRIHLALPGDAGYTFGPLAGRMAAALLGFRAARGPRALRAAAPPLQRRAPARSWPPSPAGGAARRAPSPRVSISSVGTADVDGAHQAPGRVAQGTAMDMSPVSSSWSTRTSPVSRASSSTRPEGGAVGDGAVGHRRERDVLEHPRPHLGRPARRAAPGPSRCSAPGTASPR